jgi:hypothetical protein
LHFEEFLNKNSPKAHIESELSVFGVAENLVHMCKIYFKNKILFPTSCPNSKSRILGVSFSELFSSNVRVLCKLSNLLLALQKLPMHFFQQAFGIGVFTEVDNAQVNLGASNTASPICCCK